MSSNAQGEVCIAPLVGPPARSEAEERHREAVEGLLRRLWHERSGYGISDAEEDTITRAGSDDKRVPDRLKEPGKRTSTYGEVMPRGARQIARALGIDHLEGGEPIVFMDLGSGVGKLVAQAYLEWPGVARAVGVELSSSRAAKARSAWREALAGGEAAALREEALQLLIRPEATTGQQAVHPALRAPAADSLAYLEGDLFEVDMTEVTHVYVASLCFNEAMLLRLGRKLAKDAPKLRAVAALRRFPLGVLGFEAAGSLEAEMSWTRHRGGGQTVYLYKRREDA